MKKRDLITFQGFGTIAPLFSQPGRFDFLAGCVVAIGWALLAIFA